ncbi:MAG: exodeoxyribonuclease I [Gammaproteobacteria bacterium]|jgi:exodeoxyribonuclease-1|nr:exodeoxyribonuclease I [Gammaproteobacteria bacterium]MBT3489654.1 exodeoxyribonuclease I [Gammaproteobacteria bacterium]MBT3718492.1 exodeoxyribonuclease I [Gammaproteobacteria bacterium]MBT3843909.1 exodeoxyribonuclease I [Gammaproteobacteria bacterium]MBT3893467.1 exodeoxyribonuclease I [Gammaproteobacteria bacterium]
MRETTLYWHDYETSGADPRGDRPVQFAGIRTDLELNPIGEPLMVYCRPGMDYLPQPGACMVTGITPQEALNKGSCEVDFIQQVMDELAVPGTCGVGYNTLRFDDEVTRNTLYRNLYDPYEREWKYGNSRWDLIDLLRLTRALRPEGIQWPFYEDGKPSMRLEHLTAINGIDHGMAHDALADVHATIAMARLVKEQQPKLYHYIWDHRDKKSASALLNLKKKTPLLHVSSMIPSERSNLAIVIPIARHPTNSNGVIVYDLYQDPTPLLSLSAQEIQLRLFTRNEDLPEGVDRIPLKTVHINKCPVLAPLNTLDHDSQQRLKIDVSLQLQHAGILQNSPHFAQQVSQAHLLNTFPEEVDPDRMIYSGFFGDSDKQQMMRIHTLTPEQLATQTFTFQDPRLEQLFFRFRARNWPESLNEEEQQHWRRFCQHRILDQDSGSSIHYAQFQSEIATLLQEHVNNPEKIQVLQALIEYGEQLLNQVQ